MPNWCSNVLVVKSFEEEDLAEWKAAFIEDDEFTWERWFPTPKDLPDNGWYDWNIENWGTKWGPNEAYVNNEYCDSVIVSFETAWGPPEGVIRRMGKKFPRMGFHLTYEERGMEFEGDLAIIRGEVTLNECRDTSPNTDYLDNEMEEEE